MSERVRAEYFKYRVIVATVVSTFIAWLTLSIVISVGFVVYGGSGEGGQAQAVVAIQYVPGGDNRKVLKGCSQGLRRLYQELRTRLHGVAAETVGEKAGRRWQQWMEHYKARLSRHRRHCLIDGDHDSAAVDPVLGELKTAAASISDLAQSYERVHATFVATFEEDFIALEGIFARADARLLPRP